MFLLVDHIPQTRFVSVVVDRRQFRCPYLIIDDDVESNGFDASNQVKSKRGMEIVRARTSS